MWGWPEEPEKRSLTPPESLRIVIFIYLNTYVVNRRELLGLLDADASVAANIQYMALTDPKYVFDFSLKLGKNIKGNKCLYRTGETTAVDTVSTSTLQ